jgi:hypothetical protein
LVAGAALALLFFSDRSRTRSSLEPLMAFDPALAEEVHLGGSGRHVNLMKKEGLWTIQGNIIDRADPVLVRKLLSKAAEIVPLDVIRHRDLKGAVSLEALDLKVPKRTITVMAPRSHTLAFGSDGPAVGQLYARVDSGRDVFLIPSEIGTLSFLPEEAFRDPLLTQIALDHLTEITLSKDSGLQQLALRKDVGNWKFTSPVVATADSDAVISWAKTVLAAKIERWMPPETDPASCGLDASSAIFVAREEGSKESVRITVGSPVPGSPQKFFVRCSDRPGICIVSDIAPALGVTPVALRSKQLKPVEIDAVDKIEISQPKGRDAGSGEGEDLVLERKKGSDDWEIRLGGSGAIPGDKVRSWYDELMKARAQGFETATSEKVLQYGLGNPTEIRLIAKLSENSAEENAGEMVLGDYLLGTATNGIVALREKNAPEFLIVPDSITTHPLKPLETPSPTPMLLPAK